MKRIFNFSSGPACLPEPVLKKAASEMTDWHGIGYSVMAMSHREAAFTSIIQKAEQTLRTLMNIPENYTVLFLAASASQQFSAIPMNVMTAKGKADFIITGDWSKKAYAEAARYGQANVVFSSEGTGYTSLPDPSELSFTLDADYVHYCPNETIRGVEFSWVPDTGNTPLVADMSSMILSKAVDVTRYGLIYAGAQKNIGPAGLTLVIIRNDLLKEPMLKTPSLLNYKLLADNDGLYNTPSTYGIYIAGLVFDWLQSQGGVSGIEAVNHEKAALLYRYLDQSALFYSKVEPAARSRMNVTFFLRDESLNNAFVDGAEERGLVQLGGHRTVGGMRASIYNAMPLEGVHALIDYMTQFEQQQTR